MEAGRLIPVVLAAALAAGLTWWMYARREEAVSGRLGPALLRGSALFLALAGWWLPPLWSSSGEDRTTRAVLVDRSLSMTLPASADGMSRGDSADIVSDDIGADLRFAFGDSARVLDEGAVSADGASRVIPALVAARAAGADSAILVTDGELDDREAARAATRRLGLAIREIVVSEAAPRLRIRDVDVPAAVEAGDTIRLVAEIGSAGAALGADSASLSVTAPDGSRTIQRFAAPSPGRSVRVGVEFVAAGGDGDPWRAYDVRLEADADPYGGATHREWVQVVPTAAGALIVGADADWEPHYLLPVLSRSVAGGARAWIRVGPDRWIRSGSDRMLTGDDARVRRDAVSAELLVVQGRPDEVPDWVSALAARHPRVLWLARGPGAIPGSDVRVGPPRPGEWYPGGAPPPSPIAGYLDGLGYPGLPPAGRVFEITGHDWAPLELRRNRTGSGVPPIGADRSGNRRRVVVAAEGLWRWAARSGEARQAYRSLFAGLAGWMLEASDRAPLELTRTRWEVGDTLRWRVAPGVSDLRLTVRDSAGNAVWSDSLAVSDSVLVGPPAAEGSLRFEAEGRVEGEAFRTGRPFEVEGAAAELGAHPVGLPLEGAVLGAGNAPGGGRPLWPFLLAAVMLCAEWFWRRRIGLR